MPSPLDLVCSPEAPLSTLQVSSSFDLSTPEGQSVAEIREEQGNRQRVWLKGSAASAQDSWRPKKMHRRSSSAWMRYLDSQAFVVPAGYFHSFLCCCLDRSPPTKGSPPPNGSERPGGPGRQREFGAQVGGRLGTRRRARRRRTGGHSSKPPGEVAAGAMAGGRWQAPRRRAAVNTWMVLAGLVVTGDRVCVCVFRWVLLSFRMTFCPPPPPCNVDTHKGYTDSEVQAATSMGGLRLYLGGQRLVALAVVAPLGHRRGPRGRRPLGHAGLRPCATIAPQRLGALRPVAWLVARHSRRHQGVRHDPVGLDRHGLHQLGARPRGGRYVLHTAPRQHVALLAHPLRRLLCPLPGVLAGHRRRAPRPHS